jgi:lipoprotein-anchoring transpeptidase ErfK/SrfK
MRYVFQVLLATIWLVASATSAAATTLAPLPTKSDRATAPPALRTTTLETDDAASGQPAAESPPAIERSTPAQPAPVARPSTAPARKPEAVKPVAKKKHTLQKKPATTLAAHIDLTRQRMTVRAGGKTLHTWKISSGARGHETPTGRFRPQWVARRWHSRKYDMAPMPYSVFYNGGIATHGTTSVSRLGRPASHGCIRLKTTNARKFYKLVRQHGLKRTRIVVSGRAKHPPVRRARRTSRSRARWARRGRRRTTRRTYIYVPGRRAFREERNHGYRGYGFFAYPRGRY